MYHYVYRITNIVLKKHYYGKRSSKYPPTQDIGIRYFSSSTDKAFKQDQKDNPQNYKYKVVRVFETSIDAVGFEIKLHNKLDVAKNNAFYNKAKQTATGFSPSLNAVIASAEKRRGIPLPNAHKSSISKGMLGKNSENRKKYVNIYEYKTNILIASAVCVTDWCRQYPQYSQGTLMQTTYADRSQSSCATNRLHHKQIYAQYVQ